jgi:hypothetical protein
VWLPFERDRSRTKIRLRKVCSGITNLTGGAIFGRENSARRFCLFGRENLFAERCMPRPEKAVVTGDASPWKRKSSDQLLDPVAPRGSPNFSAIASRTRQP